MELEIDGLTDAIETDFLVLYFESRRRSGGGPVSSCTRSGSQALITFENPSDADNVLCKEDHCLQSVPIRVRRPLPWDCGKVALCGLHPDTEETLLEFYVEYISSREDFLISRSADRRTVLVTFHDPLSDEEFERLEKNVQRRLLHGSSLSVQRVRLCTDILVENIGSSITTEFLEMYFESRRGGGAQVKSVTMQRNGSAAVVNFSDVNAVSRVLRQSHSLNGCSLTVSPYYPSLLGSLSSEDTGPPEDPHSEDPGIEEAGGHVLQDTDIRMEVQDGQEEQLRVPVMAEKPPPMGPPQDMETREEAEVVTSLQEPEEVTSLRSLQEAEEVTSLRSLQEAEEVTSLRSLQEAEEVTSLREAEVVMEASELRFLQEYQHELLAGMDHVTIVPLEGQDKCGFRVTGDPVSCKMAVELLCHIVSSLSSRTVTLQYPGVSLFLLEEEGQRTVQETERQHHCIVDTSHLSWRAVGCKPADPWSHIRLPDTSPVLFMAEELSEAGYEQKTPSAADIEDIKVFASLLSEENKEEIKAEEEEIDLYTDASAKGPDENSLEPGDEELEQACKMSRDEFQDQQLDEEAQLLLAIQMSMDTQDPRNEDEDLKKALEMSLRDQVLEEVEEPLQRALEMSLRSSWAADDTSPCAEDNDVSRDDKALDNAQIKVLAGDETSLVVACAAIRKAVTSRLCMVTMDGVEDFQHKLEILSALERKHKVTITEADGQTQIHGFLQNPKKCQEELSQILSAIHADGRSEAGLMMLDQTTVLIPVSETSEVYNRVMEPFLGSLRNLRSDIQILQVHKVQNSLLYKQYQLKKQSMLGQYPGTTIERTLYHGTTESGAKEICHRGFNRSFCGRNATLYGYGVYFAVESIMSARDRYSPPSSDGNKYILVAQVLTGEFTIGREDMRTPPIKRDTVSDVPQRYDSLVDNLQKPTIFVIFNDTQAYPQYLITCCNTKDSVTQGQDK